MICENIQNARKAKGLSQEDVAVQLNVVRQTVSKWEKGLSVPDADLLLRLADLLDVPVTRLLDVELPREEASLQEELARLRQEAGDRAKRESLAQLVNQKRGWILFFSFLSLLAALIAKNEAVSLLLCGGCVLAAMIVLCRNLPLLTGVPAEDKTLRSVRTTAVFDLAVFGMVAVMALLELTGFVSLSEDQGKTFAAILVAAVMLFAGFISPRLPFNRHTGLRLPWTVLDEEVWTVAHRILGWVSLPVCLLYLAASWTVSDFEGVTLAAVLLWLGIPGGLSLLFYWKKRHGAL